MDQNNQESRLGPLARPFTRTAHSFACSALLKCSAALVRSLARSLTPKIVRKGMIRSEKVNDFMSENDLVFSHSASFQPNFTSTSKQKAQKRKEKKRKKEMREIGAKRSGNIHDFMACAKKKLEKRKHCEMIFMPSARKEKEGKKEKGKE